MIHLLRSLFIGYFLAVTVGTTALAFGASPFVVLLSVWLGGSVVSVVIAATMPVLSDAVEPAFVHVGAQAGAGNDGPMHSSLTARELAKWDSDLAAERFEADLAAEDAEAQAAADASEQKTG